ncbi:MAG: stress response translation initiation inhibitor YciH [Candidatus Aenigmarchaeota archaeon ex4484_52]|nr:MAG: stress response translation initiation inhibitor YciH [Candidatus Aenigmarchaeota archaeon ex4484_52]
MSEICSKCGLPKELCICNTLFKEHQNIKILLEKKRFGKFSTIVDGINSKDINLKDLCKRLKAYLACGGTIKNNKIELQGNQKPKVINFLKRQGFENIEE